MWRRHTESVDIVTDNHTGLAFEDFFDTHDSDLFDFFAGDVR